jgi:hypothetical protein
MPVIPDATFPEAKLRKDKSAIRDPEPSDPPWLPDRKLRQQSHPRLGSASVRDDIQFVVLDPLQRKQAGCTEWKKRLGSRA